MGIVGSMNIPLVIKYRKRAQVDELSEWLDGVGYSADFEKFPTFKNFTAIIN